MGIEIDKKEGTIYETWRGAGPGEGFKLVDYKIIFDDAKRI